MHALVLAAALLASSSPHIDPDTDSDPHRQFDFWVGEWSVQNRHLGPDGLWTDGDRTRARITPVCAGAAILEEWAGPFRGGFMNGFSLRAWDPEAQRWSLLLNWTTDGNGTFGRLSGSFRHGRGEFFTTTAGPNRTRYSFSDALARSVRWDSASTSDGGRTWMTDWIMEFTRTRDASEVTQDELFRTAWTTGPLSPHPQARALDALIGSWTGTEIDAAGTEREARLRSKLLSKDSLVLDVVRTRTGPDSDWDERLTVRGYVSRSGAWESWRLSSSDTVLRSARGRSDGEAFVFEDPTASSGWQEILVLGEDELTIETVRHDEATRDLELLRTLVLERDDA